MFTKLHVATMKVPIYQTLICTLQDQHLSIRLNRPHRLNAVIEQLYADLLQALEFAETEPCIRAIVLTGEGRAFCVGADLKEHSAGSRTQLQKRRYLQLANDACQAIFNHPKPIIAAVNGYALGAGAEIAISCDFILMADDAKIGFPETSIGTCVGGGVSQILPRLIGLTQARFLMLTGDRITGAEAQKIGLATQSCSPRELIEKASILAKKLSSTAPISTALVKELLNHGFNQSMNSQLKLELNGISTCMVTADWQEGINAFAEKRPPEFKGH